MDINLVVEGFKFMVLGMSSVFLFLTLMVCVLKIQGVLLNKFFPEIPLAPANAPKVQNDNESENLIAAISVAIQRFRANKEPK